MSSNSYYQSFVLGAAGDLKEDVPESLKGFGTEEHWAGSMKKINNATSMLSAECALCCPCFAVMMLCGDGLSSHLSKKVSEAVRVLNRDHYEELVVFSSQGLKVTFDRNTVPYSKLTKTPSGQLLLEVKAKAVSSSAQMVPVLQPMQMQARPGQVVPLQYPQQQIPFQQPIGYQPQPMQQQQHVYQPMQQQMHQQQQQPQPQQYGQNFQQQPQPQFQQHYQQPQQQQYLQQYQQQPQQQLQQQPMNPQNQHLQHQPQQQKPESVGHAVALQPTIATIGVVGVIPTIAAAAMSR